MASSLSERLETHLSALQHNPATTAIDQKLIDEAELVLPDTLSAEDLQKIVVEVSSTLQTIQQDPTPLTILLQKLLRPFTFANVLSFQPPVDFTAGLGLADHLKPINKLMLYLLGKATSPSDAATIANRPDVVRALVELWLSTPDTGVATEAGRLLVDLLRIDKLVIIDSDQALPVAGSGQGLMWMRIFDDRDVYGAIFTACDSKSAGSKLSKTQITLAQARLLEVLPQVAALDWNAVSNSHNAEIEAAHNTSNLLEFAAENMVDFKDDFLLDCVLLDFYNNLITSTKDGEIEQSPGLEYLISKGLHERTVRIYLQEQDNADPIEVMILHGPAAKYTASYASLYPQHYIKSDLPKRVQRRLHQAFNLSASRWAHSDSPKHDLHVLASLPRTSLPSSSAWSSNPLSLLPSRATNPDVLNTLAVIFHGPEQEVRFSARPSITGAEHETKEAAAARALYFNYLANNRTFWKDIASHADTVALKDLALAAIRVLHEVITSNWSTEDSISVPSASIPTPDSGHVAILSPPALEYALPYLMKPPQTFSNLVGGRGDAESAAYKIAMAKLRGCPCHSWQATC